MVPNRLTEGQSPFHSPHHQCKVGRGTIINIIWPVRAGHFGKGDGQAFQGHLLADGQLPAFLYAASQPPFLCVPTPPPSCSSKHQYFVGALSFFCLMKQQLYIEKRIKNTLTL